MCPRESASARGPEGDYPPRYSLFLSPSGQSELVQNQNTWGIGGTRTPSISLLMALPQVGQVNGFGVLDVLIGVISGT